ncbi:MAG TPA: tyrosine-type recombinase/integrase, partial [Myxococcota bacterium]|nr:tyrosine-type recombinase/integrase [Myxococcota bacterium]
MFLRYLTLDGTDPETVPVTAMNRDNLNGFQLWLQAQGRTLTTIAKRAQALRLAWEWLHEGTDRAWLDAAPRRIATKKTPAARPVAPTWAEADACLRACLHHDPRAEWLYPFALLARFTGLRRSEILRLKWEHIDIAAGILDVHGQITKGGYSGRRFPVSPHLLTELATLPRDDQWIVPAPEKERIAADGDGRGHVDRNMRRAWVRAGVPSAKWSGQPCHAFRKTMRTEMELLDVRREVIDYLIGHQPEGTGARHYHIWRYRRHGQC